MTYGAFYHRTYPAAPILERIDLRVKLDGIAVVAEAFASMHGLKPDSARTAIERMRKSGVAAERVVDDWCIFFGTSLAALYPEEFAA